MCAPIGLLQEQVDADTPESAGMQQNWKDGEQRLRGCQVLFRLSEHAPLRRQDQEWEQSVVYFIHFFFFFLQNCKSFNCKAKIIPVVSNQITHVKLIIIDTEPKLGRLYPNQIYNI